MEIYKELNSQESKEFENLLNSQLSKTKIEEGKVIDGIVTKITNKYVYTNSDWEKDIYKKNNQMKFLIELYYNSKEK